MNGLVLSADTRVVGARRAPGGVGRLVARGGVTRLVAIGGVVGFTPDE